EVQEVLERCCPQIIVCFAGAAQFSQGGPITMTKEDVFEVCNNAPLAKVVVTHLEAWNHCYLSRQEMKEFMEQNSMGKQVYVPDDGEWICF
ncbi:MAG TPA: MBL fold metallo-hydrolase, partial [Syntrophomonadaceae bacterium]|nr:MBL fold metallo-hydrolase [Syntrophomonadaceae bacterium]